MEKEKSLKEKIQEFYKNGGRYEEKEIDFGKSKGVVLNSYILSEAF